MDQNLSYFEHSPQDTLDAYHYVSKHSPHIVVFKGLLNTSIWLKTFNPLFPNLIMVESTHQSNEEIINMINQYLWKIRHQELNQIPETNIGIQSLDLNKLLMKYSFNDDSTHSLKYLINKYDIQKFMSYLSNEIVERNLFCLDLLDQHLSHLISNQHKTILDVGTKEWSYVASLTTFFNSKIKDFQLNGIEIDPYFIHANQFTRKEQAEHFAKLSKSEFQVMDFFDWNQSRDIIIFFLPIILKENVLRWRIPLKYFKPDIMFEHALKLLKPRGLIIIYNGVAIEHKKTLLLLNNLGCEPIVSSSHMCRLRRKHQGYITIIKK